jgi:Tfp pilus assembly protein PilO
VTIALDHRTKVLIAVVLMLALAAGGWLIGVQPALGAAFAAAAQEADVRVQNDAARTQLAQLQEADKNLPALQQQLDGLEESIPATPNTSALLADLDDLAASTGVTVDRFTVDSSTPYTAPGTDATGAATADAAAPAVDPALVPLIDPRITGGNFVVVPVTVDVSGKFDGVLGFLAGVQSGDRLFLVNRLSSVSEADSGGDANTVKSTIAGFVYVLLDEEDSSAPAADAS